MQSCDIFCGHGDTVSDFTNMNAGGMLSWIWLQCHWVFLFCLFSGGVYIAFVCFLFLFCVCVFVCCYLGENNHSLWCSNSYHMCTNEIQA